MRSKLLLYVDKFICIIGIFNELLIVDILKICNINSMKEKENVSASSSNTIMLIKHTKMQ